AVGTLSAVELRSPLGALGRLGFDPGAVLARAGIAAATIEDPASRVAADVEHAFWAAAEAISGDPAIRVRAGIEHAKNGTWSLIEYIVVHSPTLREAIQGAQRILPLVDDLGHLDLTESGELASVSIHRDGIDRARGYVDWVCAVALTFYA